MEESELTEEQKQKQKILHSFFSSTAPLQLKKLPSKQQKLLIVLRRISQEFEPGKIYSEQEVKELLAKIYSDYSTLRRSLVDFGYIKRTRDGSSYWREKTD